MIIGMAAQDIVCAAVNSPERAVLQTNEVKQIDGVEVEFEVAIVAEHLERNRDDGLGRVKEAVEIVSAREPGRIDLPADLQKSQLLVRPPDKGCADRPIRHLYEPVMSTQEIE